MRPLVGDDHPALGGREIPDRGDEHVDPAISANTACVRFTPPRRPNDFAIGARHGLRPSPVMAQGRHHATPRGPASPGWIASSAPPAVCSGDGSRQAFLVKGGGPIATAWAVFGSRKVRGGAAALHPWFPHKAEPLAAPAARPSMGGGARFVAAAFLAEGPTATGSLTSRDWCISRQLWWAAPHPAWFAGE